MTTLDLDAIQVNAEWAAGRAHDTSVAHRVLSTDIPSLIAEVKALRGKVAVVDALHFRRDVPISYNRWVTVCDGCGGEYPCFTIRALHPAAPTTGEPE